jgi:para-nitrobenzyl esterase
MNMKRPAYTALLMTLLGGTASFAHAAIRDVNVTGGKVEGFVADGVTSFKGIPFAASPVGTLRWRAPQPVIPWKGTRRADRFSLPCVQPTWAAFPSSEDCLYLNVWTAATHADERRPVMVWIHGGGFYTGATWMPALDGTRFAKAGVVLVSIAYRLGPFGFLAHPELSRESGAGSGDYGLEDQIAALRWVKRNIDQFGGDPDRVTIFGQSAGAQSVSLLAVSPLARGLFERAIAESGSVFQPPGTTIATLRSLEHAEATGETFLRELGATSIEAGRALPAMTLNAALQKSGKFGEFGKFWPVLDGHVIPADDYEAYQDGRFNDVPVLAGWNSNDGDGASDEVPRGATSSWWEHGLLNHFGPEARSVIALYPHANPAAVIQANRDLARDVAFAWSAWTWARLETTKGRSKAFLYYFDARSPDLPDGAIHTAEIPYVFGNSGVMGLSGTPLPPFRTTDRRLSDLMQQYWVNFATTGDPNGPGLPTWPAFSDHDERVMFLDDHPGAGPIPNRKQLQTFDEYFARRRTHH